MGAAAAYDLARSPGVEMVLVADQGFARARDALALAEKAKAVPGAPRGGRARLEMIQLDVTDRGAVISLLRNVDCALSAVPYPFNEDLTRAAVEAGTHLCDLGGNDAVVRQQHAFSDAAKKARIRVIPDCGLVPGLGTVLAAEAAAGLAPIEEIRIRCGGIPVKPEGPLRYRLVFSAAGLVNEYVEPVKAIRSGRLEERPPLTEIEEIEFPAPFGKLEAFLTSGGLSTLPETMQGRVQEMDDKTIRYPGHAALVRALLDLGLASREKVRVGDAEVEPRAVFERLLERALPGEGEDAVLLRVWATGKEKGQRVRRLFELIDRGEPKVGITAMARTTAFAAAAVARLSAFGEIKETGVLRQETAVPAKRLLEELEARGLVFRRESGPVPSAAASERPSTKETARPRR
jgi:lysine 6-dehydrogenase